MAKLKVQGTASLIAFARDLQRTLPNVHHCMSNFAIDVSGDRARGRCELNEFMARPEAVYPNLQGYYEDDFVFDGERWLIKHRRVFVAEPRSTISGKRLTGLAGCCPGTSKNRRSTTGIRRIRR